MKEVGFSKIIFLLAGILIALSFVFAATSLNVPVASGNYSGTLNLSASTDYTAAINATFYYNASGGKAIEFLWEILNTSSAQVSFENSSFDISSLSDGKLYNISVLVVNQTAVSEYSSVSNVTIDNTAPNVSFSGITNVVNNGNYSGTIVLNVSVLDSTLGVESVYFNITNSSGTQINWTKASGSTYYNLSLNTSVFGDGAYNVTVYANDSYVNNLNNSEVLKLVFDNTAPTVSLASSSTARNSLTLTISATDATSGVLSCSSDRSGATVTTSSLTESSLNCGTTYTYVVNCLDSAGNSGTVTSSFATTACSSSASSGSSSFWTETTYVVNEEEFKAGYSKSLKLKQRLKVNVGYEAHYVGLKSLEEDKVIVEIASEPIEVELAKGEDLKVDVSGDGYYDLYLKLNGISGTEADLFIQSIYEKIPEDKADSPIESSGTVIGDKSSSEEEKSSNWGWIIAILLLIVAIGFAAKKLSSK